ncbi:MAG: lipase, partial [Nocardioides sp.]|nr:lipase [Nocardioides sp.]
MKRVLVALLAAVAATITASPASPAAAATDPYAPVTRPGPALSVSAATVRAATVCHGDPHKGGEPVLLNPATSVTPEQDYSWTYEKAFTAQGRYWCAVTMPYHTEGDIQTAAEYLVSAIRTMHAATGRRIAVMGHSQGGMSMRWALRFWPGLRPMVDDVIGMAGSNHGSTALPACQPGVTTCTPAVWQQQASAAFIKALNSHAETFHNISYTEIYTHTDEIVQPNYSAASSSSALHTGTGRITNVATQDICPTDVYEHLLAGTIDPTTYALVMDALTHAGPAAPSRISRSVCGQLYMPYVDPSDVHTYLEPLGALPTVATLPVPEINLAGAPQLAAEPKLR